jgi:catechol 2,3-dioxygenase-like lactoylglutathione lyase family enzyme
MECADREICVLTKGKVFFMGDDLPLDSGGCFDWVSGMLKAIDHLNIVVRDVEGMALFFESLGFVQEDRARLEGEWISSIVGLEDVQAEYIKLHLPGTAMRLELIRYEHPTLEADPLCGQANRPGFRHLAFEVEDIEAEVCRLSEQGISFLGPVQTYAVTGKKLVYFRGPEGVLLELAEYPRVVSGGCC